MSCLTKYFSRFLCGKGGGLLLSLVFASACSEPQDKLLSYFKPFKEITIQLKTSNVKKEVSFIFLIDTSTSMDGFRTLFSENIQYLLRPLFENYPHYDYNFAFSSLQSNKERLSSSHHPLFLDFGQKFTSQQAREGQEAIMPLKATCELDDHLKPFARSFNLGWYFRYTTESIKKLSHEELICVLSYNVRTAQWQHPVFASEESYFQNLSHVVSSAEESFKKRFFGPEKFLILFFLSDNYTGVEYDSLRRKEHPQAEELIAERIFKLLKSVMGRRNKNISSYAAVLDDREPEEEWCSGEQRPEESADYLSISQAYPFHLYRFIEKTGGLRVSICHPEWGKKFKNIFDNLKQSFHFKGFHLPEIPRMESLQVLLNGKEVPQNTQTGWYLDMEDTYIHLSPDMDYLPYLLHREMEENIFTIRYQPINIEILDY